MKKVFLDCGTHFGQGLSGIVDNCNIDSSWEIHSWEANPFTFREFNKDGFLPDLNINFYNQAISTVNGEMTLNVETTKDGNHTGQGSSIVDISQWNSPLHKGNFLQQVTVPTIDFSKFILEKFNNTDYIILKMDIEGAEYNVLEKMINESSVDLINEIFIEWHSRFFPNRDEIKTKEYEIINILKSKNIKVNNWI